MNATESLKNHEPSVVNKIIVTTHQEEVIRKYGFAFFQLLLCAVKVKLDVKAFHKFSNWILIGVRLL